MFSSTFDTKAKSFPLLINEVMQILIGVGLLACCSQVSIPLQPVPITLQTVAVMLIGLFYSRTAALKTLGSYLTLGACGVPVFANFMGGINVLFGPTGGYLWGFLLAVLVMTTAREHIRKETYLTMICNGLVGNFVVYLLGVTWLALFCWVIARLRIWLLSLYHSRLHKGDHYCRHSAITKDVLVLCNDSFGGKF